MRECGLGAGNYVVRASAGRGFPQALATPKCQLAPGPACQNQMVVAQQRAGGKPFRLGSRGRAGARGFWHGGERAPCLRSCD